MAATYAALVSLQNTIVLEQRPRYHPYCQISIDDEGLIAALQRRVNFWAWFLEAGMDLAAEHLEDRMADAAYAAEDAIESYVVSQVLPRADKFYGSAQLCQVLRNVLQDMDSICKEIGGSPPCATDSSSAPPHGDKGLSKDLQPTTGSSKYVGCSTGEKGMMVGFEDEKKRVIEELIWRNKCGRTVIPVVGMGGSGKTTLAKNVYADLDVVDHFDFRAWVTVSQVYNIREIFIGVLKDLGDEEMLRKHSDEDLEDLVHKTLFGRRYLIVLDDIWSTDAWDEIQRFFPDDHQGSRIMLTTRDLVLAYHVSTSPVRMNCLNKVESWNLLCEKVFGPDGTCPSELEDAGREIVLNCRGLPLSIVVIGGLLATSKDKSYWEHIAELSSSAVHLDKEQNCSQILSLSYNQLPIYLKPCFLYIGVFPEDHTILVSELINLWIAEGLITPSRGKSLDEIAEVYLMRLTGANLITIHNLCSTGEKYCKIHDLLRELCLREAQEEKFLCVVTSDTLHNPPCMVRPRRVVILLNRSEMEENSDQIDTFLSTSHPRSLIVSNYEGLLSRVLGSPIFKLLRVFFVIGGDYNPNDTRDHACLSKILFDLVNLRYLACGIDSKFTDTFVSSIGHLGNLQTLVVRNFINYVKVPDKIWNLPELRHIEFDIISLFKPPFGELERHGLTVLKNLQTVKRLLNFSFEEGIIEEISNVKELDIWYTESHWERKEDWSDYCFDNLGRCLEKLESFKCTFYPPVKDCYELFKVFPNSLEKLSLSGCNLLWVDMTIISSLPHLEVLELRNGSFRGSDWDVEGKFPSLKFLYMRCLDLKKWTLESTHFPCLQHLLLYDLQELSEIPSDIGEIGTLELIELDYCPDPLITSAISILEEQQDFGNEKLLVKVTPGMQNQFSFNELENKNILVDSKRRECYMLDVLKSYAAKLGMDALGDIGDCPDQSFDPDLEDYEDNHVFLFSKCWVHMYFLTEYR